MNWINYYGRYYKSALYPTLKCLERRLVLWATRKYKRLRNPQLISEKNLARLLAETGPLAGFDHWRKLMRYAGLNLVTRQSGTFKGPDRISKKGRSLLRKVLHAIALPLVRKRELYGPYYHKKKEQGQVPGNKAMTIVARHLLRKIYGWYRSGQPFDEQRFFTCKSKCNHMLAKAA